MRRRPKIDLGQGSNLNPREESRLNRKRQRWAEVNKDKPPEENPYLIAIRPDQEQYGDFDEKGEELRQRLNNLEFGNFPGYFNYRTKAAVENKLNNQSQKIDKIVEKQVDQEDHNKKTNESEIISDNKSIEDINKNNYEFELDDGLSDERLKHFRREWFENKDCLDIGCNRGHIVYAIARLFSPNLIVGIDIDLKMIQMANRDLHLHLEKGLISEANDLRKKRAAKLKVEGIGEGSYIDDCNQFPLSSYIRQGPIALMKKHQQQLHYQKETIIIEQSKELDYNEKKNNEQQQQQPETSNLLIEINSRRKEIEGEKLFPIDMKFESKFPNNIIFLEHNYVLSKDDLVDKQMEQFDTIVCLSVTKWIHLNYRDVGLKRFFRRVYKHLRKDGLFILEAQPFDNYARRKKLSERLKANYNSIEFKPEQFDNYLLSAEIGFKKIIYSTITEHECLGFKRPIKVFIK